MHKFSIQQIISKIKRGETFEAEAEDQSLYIKIEDYVPFVCAAIHDGNNFREELKAKVIHSDHERWYEEDPCTLNFISGFPIVIAGRDSRFEYDLNRSEDNCIYKDAWGKPVWKEQLTTDEKARSLAKYHNFYKVAISLVEKLESLFTACVVYDIHSYNWKRHPMEVPVFNLGTEKIDHKRFNAVKKHFLEGLASIELPNIINTTKENDIFQGNGNFLVQLTREFDNTLVFATEVKKVYCNEETGEEYKLVIDAISEGFKKVILENALLFAKKHTNLKVKNHNKLLSKELDKNILQVDKALHRLVKNFEILKFVNPVNIESEKKKFIKRKGHYSPNFRYKQINLDPFLMKRKLMNLPVENIRDVQIQAMYKDVINSYIDKVELIASIGTEKFLYNSLRYFGEPSQQDIDNAEFILHFNAPQTSEPSDLMTDSEALKMLKKELEKYDFDCKIVLSDKLAAKAMVVNSEKTLYLKKGVKFSKKEVFALLHHEIGVHMVTTMNADAQPIKIFSLGLPLNTKTQEGLAIWSEYYSGNLTLKRLKELSLRVVGINSMVKGKSFEDTARMFMDKYGLEIETAFYLTTRIYRGGGFTKDFLYLSGLQEICHQVREGEDFEGLMIGKTHLSYLPIINEMIDRKMIEAPTFENPAYQQNNNEDKLVDFIVENIK